MLADLATFLQAAPKPGIRSFVDGGRSGNWLPVTMNNQLFLQMVSGLDADYCSLVPGIVATAILNHSKTFVPTLTFISRSKTIVNCFLHIIKELAIFALVSR